VPYVLQLSSTTQIYTSRLVNHYGLAYYGVKYWNEHDEAESEKLQFLHDAGILEPTKWNIIELEEGEMKLCNVKLKNDPDYLLFWSDARKPEVRRREN
jgi:hypothetical protein